VFTSLSSSSARYTSLPLTPRAGRACCRVHVDIVPLVAGGHCRPFFVTSSRYRRHRDAADEPGRTTTAAGRRPNAAGEDGRNPDVGDDPEYRRRWTKTRRVGLARRKYLPPPLDEDQTCRTSPKEALPPPDEDKEDGEGMLSHQARLST
jgi:hypothetical protein